MSHRYEVTRTIHAPIERVFERISDVSRFSEVNEDVVAIEFLTEQQQGVGTRFKETRNMKGRLATTTLEITELVPDRLVRFVSDEGGTIWDTVMAVSVVDGATELRMTMDARPYKLTARFVNLLIRGMIQRAVTDDMDKLKAWCEARNAG